MVEELAKWKAALCQRTTDLQEAIKRLLEDCNHIRDISLKTYRYVYVLRSISSNNVQVRTFYFISVKN